MSTLRLSVTLEDIAAGKRYNPWRCPLALALCRQLPDADEVAVTPFKVTVDAEEFGLSRRARRWILRFDSYEGVVPATFVLSFMTTDKP